MKTVHRAAALLATVTIAAFFTATALVELFGSPQAVAATKALIVLPGLLLLVPALAAAGASGFVLSRARRGALVQAKKKRMRIIAGLGLMVLLPCALLLDWWAAQGAFGLRFYMVQGVELVAGAVNLSLMRLNLGDGLRLGGSFRRYNCNNHRISPG